MKSVYFLILTLIALCTAAKMKSTNVLRLSNLNVNMSHNNISTSTSFKAHVMLDENDRGIIISPSSVNSPERYLRLVGEKQDGYDETYLIDYRLLRSCDMNVTFSDADATSLNVLLSLQSLENRSKNKRYELNVELVDYHRMFPNRRMSDVKKILKSKCEKRKREIESMKRSFIDGYNELHLLRKNMNDIVDKITKEQNEVKKYNTSITDALSQINSISKLNSSYSTQLSSIKAISSSSHRLISSTTAKLKEYNESLIEIENEIDNITKVKMKNEDVTVNYRTIMN